MDPRIYSILSRVLTPYFRVAPLPETFTELAVDPHPTLVVTESGSPLISALLQSFSTRAGLRRAERARPGVPLASDGRTLYWATVHEPELIHELTRSNPSLRVRTLNIFSRRGPLRSRPSYRLSIWDLAGIVVFCRFLVIFLGPPLAHTG